MLTIRKFNSLPNLANDFFNHELPFNWNQNWLNNSSPAVNIIDGKNEFKIELAIPGYQKDEFKINVENDLLTVSANKESKFEESEETYTRREFNYSSFSRSFTLPETVAADDIKAEHKDGILRIYIPKKEEAKPKPSREIAIA
jgi:HSP20 family protein